MEHRKKLRTYLKTKDISVEAFIGRVGKSRQTVYNWFDLKSFPEDVMTKVIERGKVPSSIFNHTELDGRGHKNGVENQNSENMKDEIKEIIESNKHYRATIDRQLAIIEQLTGMNRQQGKAA